MASISKRNYTISDIKNHFTNSSNKYCRDEFPSSGPEGRRWVGDRRDPVKVISVRR